MADRRSRILDAAARLIADQGYSHTSVDDVIAAAGLSGKAHFYHYFRSKQELGYAVIDRQFERFTEKGLVLLREPMIDPLDRLGLFIDALVASQAERGGRGGSPMGTVAAELAGSDDGIRERIALMFERWSRQLQALLWEAGPQLADGTDRTRLANFIIAALEGAMMISRVRHDVSVMEGVGADLKRFIAMHIRGGAGHEQLV